MKTAYVHEFYEYQTPNPCRCRQYMRKHFANGWENTKQSWTGLCRSGVGGEIAAKCTYTDETELLKHIEEYSLLRENHHGFCKGKSCLTNLLEFTEKVNKHVSNCEPGDIIYLDFQKGFDNIPHWSKLGMSSVESKFADDKIQGGEKPRLSVKNFVRISTTGCVQQFGRCSSVLLSERWSILRQKIPTSSIC